MAEHEIITDGRVVWVNGPILLGRFSKNGIDVHVEGKCAGESCSPGPTTLDDWHKFKTLMLGVHSITVDDKYKPDFLKDKA